MTRRDPVKLTDPRAIRALAHPARLAVLEELYGGRELTATECAEIVGLSPSAMSYHLRSLEKVGIVERADSGSDGRERPWRAAGSYLQVESDSGVAEAAALGATVVSRLREQLAAWEARRGEEDQVWRDASMLASGQLWLRAEELQQLSGEIDKLIELHRGRTADDRPADSRRVRFSIFAFPSEGPDAARR